ncbi:MAG: DUF4476 domain-containing protein [Chitinophagales bacterium]|nr:DUF4476 domain-containing protein [Chitinophagales bacterium]
MPTPGNTDAIISTDFIAFPLGQVTFGILIVAKHLSLLANYNTMKLLLQLFFISFISINFAQNRVTIFSEDGEPFYLILNGIRQNENPETNVQVQGLTSDYYTGKIIFNNEQLPDIDKKFLMATGEGCKPCEVTYKIKYNKKGEIALKAYSFSSLAMAPPPASNVQIIQFNTKPMPAPLVGVHVVESTTTTTTNTGDNVNMGINIGGLNMGVNVNVNDGYGGTTTTHSTTTTTYTTQTVEPTYVVAEDVCYPMSETNFNNLVNSINAKSFEDSKLTLAKQATTANCLKASQIKRLLNLFTFEDNKLELAKHAYLYCYDPQNYYQVNDAFTYESSIDELDNYIGGQ